MGKVDPTLYLGWPYGFNCWIKVLIMGSVLIWSFITSKTLIDWNSGAFWEGHILWRIPVFFLFSISLSFSQLYRFFLLSIFFLSQFWLFSISQFSFSPIALSNSLPNDKQNSHKIKNYRINPFWIISVFPNCKKRKK